MKPSSSKTAHKSTIEFTRSKNWSQTILDELCDIIHVLSSKFDILYCSSASRMCLGYQPSELIGHTYTEYLHLDDIDSFKRDFFNQQQKRVLRTIYRFKRKDGQYVLMEMRGQYCTLKAGRESYYFVSARLIPTKATKMINTFLNYKTQNEILRRKILAVTKKEKEENHHDNEQKEEEGALIQSSTSSREENEQLQEPITLQPSIKQNVYAQGILSRYGVNESIALFTGLHFDSGERSRGISMGLEEAELFDTTIHNKTDTNHNDENKKADILLKSSGKKRSIEKII
ncbi:uncharacterized protein BX663DRAFT_501022 [Cokeromyces recurvatus]|uniref:uncharacterized protein n=1 Tax=Cokeromyces recurvatus TaxID=90255 RepID=UPI002220634C|nr:uncharacterized protein BX663DRAFT_501022 [Cokeromyces recurvatus]KAI7904914.1 hypothetical protein BX663DRAFT_501022 [Cokeromyces recurvatus]